MVKQIHVVGAVIIKDGFVLGAQRGPQGNLPGMWEFPRGKVELGESPAAALEREIREELDCAVEVGRAITTTKHEYEFGEVILTTFYCTIVAGTPTLTEHVAVKWLRPQELDTLPWAPADVPAVNLIRADHAG